MAKSQTTRAGNVGVHVKGIPELSRALRDVDRDFQKEFRKELLGVAQLVVDDVPVPFDTGEAHESLKPRATMKGAGIQFPGGGLPWKNVKGAYYPWLDFGGTTGRGHVSNGHNGYGGSIKRARVKDGRYLYPTIADSREKIADAAEEAIERAGARNQLVVR